MIKFKFLWLFVFIHSCGALANAQSTTVTGPLLDPGSNVWSAAKITAQFVEAPGVPGPYTWSGGTFNRQPTPVVSDSSGNFSITLPNNNAIVPSGSTWQLIVSPNETLPAAVVNIVLTGGTLNLSTALTSVSAWPNSLIAPLVVPKTYNSNNMGVLPNNVGGFMIKTNPTLGPYWFDGTAWQSFNIAPGACTSNCVITNPSATQHIVQPTGSTLAGNSINQQLFADEFTGSDIGAKINAAYQSVSGSSGTPTTGVVVNLAPDGAYSYTTTIRIPNNVSSPYITAPVLDCHGATLTYTGSGEAFTVLGENAYGSGEIRNCKPGVTNTAATFTLWSRIGFKMTHNVFSLGLTGITIKNDLAHGGPGYTEQQYWQDNQFSVPASGIGYRYVEDASILGNTSLGSFFFNVHLGEHFDLQGTSQALRLVAAGGAPQPTDFGSVYQIKANLGGNTNTVVYLENNTVMTRGVMNITGENSGGGSPDYDVFASNSASIFAMSGISYLTGTAHGYGSGVPEANVIFLTGQQIISNDLCSGIYGTITQSGEAGGINNARNSKNIQCGGATLSLLANNGSENDGYKMVGRRTTDNSYSDVDIAGASGNPINSITYQDALGYLGFGPGFSFAPRVVSGVDISKPLSTTSPEFRSSMTVRDPQATNSTLADGGSYIQRTINHSTGDVSDLFLCGTSGQPTCHYRLQIYGGYGGVFSPVTVFDCLLSSIAKPSCTLPNSNRWSCQPGLGDGVNAIPAGTYLQTTCRNETASTITLNAIRCVTDTGTNTCAVTNSAGTSLLTGAITGSPTYANGTQSGTTTLASGDYLKVSFVMGGTGTQIGIDISGNY